MKKTYSYIITILLFIAILSGCQGATEEENIEQENESVNEEVNIEPTFGGELKLAIRNPEILNPLVNMDRTINEVLKLSFDSLFLLDEKEKPVANLVESYDFADNGTSVTIKLKENILFHDGEELHSDDVIYSINTIKNAEDSIYKVSVENYARTSIIDDYTFKIYFYQNSAYSLYTMTFPIIPQHYYTNEGSNSQIPLGTGAYKATSFDPMKSLNLTANTEWFRGNVYVENIECIVTKEDEIDTYAFDQKIIDIISPMKFNWQQYADNKEVSLNEFVTYYYDFVGFNFNNRILADANIRKAIAHAINRQEIVDNEYLGHASITEYPFHPNSWINNDEELIYSYDKEVANSIIQEAGWLDSNEDKILDKSIDGIQTDLQLTLLVNNENQVRVNIAEAIKTYLEEIGFVIELDLVDSATFNQKLDERSYDIVLAGWKLSPIPDLTFAFHSSNIENGFNFINYQNNTMDNLLAATHNSLNDDQLESNIEQIKELIAEDLPYYSLYFRTSAILKNNNVVRGELSPSTYDNFRGIENLYIIK